jgi:hypothetical protein
LQVPKCKEFFLTDHSNIGNTHSKPITDIYDVELLNNLIKRIIYQFSFVPDYDTAFASYKKSDTSFVFNSPVIAREVIDPSRNISEQQPESILIDFTDNPVQDTIVKEAKPNDNLNTDTLVEQTNTTKKKCGIRYYPNPTVDVITLAITGSISVLFLTDISGKLLSTFPIKGESNLRIDFRNIATD